MVCVPVRIFPRYLVLIVFFVLAISFGILIPPPRSHAQNGTAANQEAGQGATSPAAGLHHREKVELPDGDGKAIAEQSCQACHGLTNLTQASKSLGDWRATVQIMINNGADVPADKVDALVKYLAENFGVKGAAPAPDNQMAPTSSTSSHAVGLGLPAGAGEKLVEGACQSCHTLANLTSAHLSAEDWRKTVQLMMDRGAVVPPDKEEALVQYLAKNFGPKDAAPTVGATSISPAQPR